MDNTIDNNLPSQNIVTDGIPSQGKTTKSFMSTGGKLLIALFISLLITIVVLLSVFIFKSKQKKSGTLKASRIPVNITPQTTTTPLVVAPSKLVNTISKKQSHIVYYMHGNDLYYYDTSSNIEKKAYTFSGLTNPDATIGMMSKLTPLANNILGYYICDSVPGDNHCSLNLLNIATGFVTKLEDRLSGDNIMMSGFFDRNQFAYLYEDTVSGKARQVFVGSKIASDGSKLGFLFKEFNAPSASSAYGRGSFLADDLDIRYSPDGKYVSFINTSNVENGFDFQIRLYDTSTGSAFATRPSIIHATHPFWLDNNKIAYRMYENSATSGNGDISIYDMSTDTISSIGIPSAQRSNSSFSVLDNFYLYSTDKKDVVIFDKGTITSKAIVKLGEHPIWVNSDNIVFTPLHICADCYDGYKRLDPVIYNIKSHAYVKTLTGAKNYKTSYPD